MLCAVLLEGFFGHQVSPRIASPEKGIGDKPLPKLLIGGVGLDRSLQMNADGIPDIVANILVAPPVVPEKAGMLLDEGGGGGIVHSKGDCV